MRAPGIGKTADTIADLVGRRLFGMAGASVDELRQARRALSKEVRELPPRALIAAAERVSRMPRPGHRFVAYELILRHPSAPGLIGPAELARLGRGMASWDAVDCFSIYLSGPAWRAGGVPDSLIHRWARSPDRWWRRAALVSTVPLNSAAGRGDARRTLRVCRMLEADRDPMVVKALSWALRVLSKRDPEAVRAHLAARSGALAALVRREVRNKLETGLKNPGRRTPKR